MFGPSSCLWTGVLRRAVFRSCCPKDPLAGVFFLRVVPYEGFLLVGVGRATASIRADHPSPNELVNLKLHSYEPCPRWSLHRTLCGCCRGSISKRVVTACTCGFDDWSTMVTEFVKQAGSLEFAVLLHIDFSVDIWFPWPCDASRESSPPGVFDARSLVGITEHWGGTFCARPGLKLS